MAAAPPPAAGGATAVALTAVEGPGLISPSPALASSFKETQRVKSSAGGGVEGGGLDLAPASGWPGCEAAAYAASLESWTMILVGSSLFLRPCLVWTQIKPGIRRIRCLCCIYCKSGRSGYEGIVGITIMELVDPHRRHVMRLSFLRLLLTRGEQLDWLAGTSGYPSCISADIMALSLPGRLARNHGGKERRRAF